MPRRLSPPVSACISLHEPVSACRVASACKQHQAIDGADTLPFPSKVAMPSPPTSLLQGFYVDVDFHFEQPELRNDITAFTAQWRRLWRDFARLPYYNTHLAGRVVVELANEWDKFDCKWDTPGSSERLLLLERCLLQCLLCPSDLAVHDQGRSGAKAAVGGPL